MAPEEYHIRRISLENVSAYLVHGSGGAMLVDSGRAGSEGKILETLSVLGLQPEALKLLILTHAHYDHAGSAGMLKELTGCRIVIHHTEKEQLMNGSTGIPRGTRWKARVLAGVGKPFIRWITRYPGTEPDILSEESLDLAPHGFPGRIIHTPGHTRGSQVVLMEGGELLAGDTLFGLPGKLHFPPYAEDLPSLLRSWIRIRDLPVKTIFPAHGARFTVESFQDEFPEAMKRYGRWVRE
jgi:glyoxylase-like metal-dependent hydrolase (beta-lactamase superfamily II)